MKSKQYKMIFIVLLFFGFNACDLLYPPQYYSQLVNTGKTTAPTVISTVPANLATGVSVNGDITATFSEAMDPLTITTATFTLQQGVLPVPGSVTYAGVIATFNPSNDLVSNTSYTATITTGARDLAGNPLAADYSWSFTTVSASAGPAPVNLGTATNFVILAITGISTIGTSAVTGNIGLSPASATLLTGFGLTMDGSGEFSTSVQVTGSVYAANYTEPTPTMLTAAVNDMGTAYADAAGRSSPDYTELGAGEIGGLTLTPGLYDWTTALSISSNVTLDGGPNDVWIFQVTGGLSVSSNVNVFLSGGALAKNIFWQVDGSVTLNTNSHLEGIVLASSSITLENLASVNGRLLSQTAVTIDSSTVTQP